MRACLQALGLAIDRGEQVVDVVALQQTLAQCVERRTSLCGAPISELLIPTRAQRFHFTLVFLALQVDRLARRFEALPQRCGIAARLTRLTNLVELFVQLEHFLEQAGRNLGYRLP